MALVMCLLANRDSQLDEWVVIFNFIINLQVMQRCCLFFTIIFVVYSVSESHSNFFLYKGKNKVQPALAKPWWPQADLLRSQPLLCNSSSLQILLKLLRFPRLVHMNHPNRSNGAFLTKAIWWDVKSQKAHCKNEIFQSPYSFIIGYQH